MTVKEGWRGRCFEDFTVGDVYQHALGRTVLPTDNAWFTLLTQNTNPQHFDHHYAAQTEFGRPLVDSTFTLALVTGQSVTDVSQNAFANLGWDVTVASAGAGLRGRHDLLAVRGARSARLQVTSCRRHRHGAYDGL
jgi:itaconyl-CoA hydratase